MADIKEKYCIKKFGNSSGHIILPGKFVGTWVTVTVTTPPFTEIKPNAPKETDKTDT